MSSFPEKYHADAVINTSSQETANFMSRVYGWMILGLLITGIVSYEVASYPELINIILENKLIFGGLIVLQLVAVFALAGLTEKLNVLSTIAIYLAYSVLTGLTLSVIFIAFTGESIVSAFAVTIFSFAGLSLFGYATKRDLGPIASFCTMGLFGLIGIGLLSFFVPVLMDSVAQKVMGVAGIIIFAGLTAYDTKKIKELAAQTNKTSDEIKKESIHGALILYLDFINLFLSILRLMGGRK